MSLERFTRRLNKRETTVLEQTSEARRSHGLLHQDALRYAHHARAKVKRASAVSSKKSKKNKKSVVATEEPETEQKTLLAEQDAQLRVLLFKAERDWAFALLFKQAGDEEPRKRHHAIRKLKRAAQYAKSLLELLEKQGRFSEDCLLEARAYASTMTGHLSLERREWQVAFDAFGLARTIYSGLAASGTSQRQTTLCQIAIDDMDPSIRYCAFHLKMKGGQTMDIGELLDIKRAMGNIGDFDGLAPQLEKLLEQAKQTGPAQTLQWRSHTLPLSSLALIENLQAVQQSKTLLEKNLQAPLAWENSEDVQRRLDAYDSVLGVYWEATTAVEHDWKAYSEEVSRLQSSQTAQKTTELETLVGYVAYNRLLTTVDRNAFLAEWTRFKLENPKLVMDNVKKNLKQEDPVKLYDLAITTLEEAQKLPVMELDPSLAVIVDALILAQKANRALYILSLYSQSGKIQEACGLLARCNEYVTSARSLLYSAKRGSVEDSELVQAQSQVEALAGRIKMEQIRLSAFLTLEQITDLNRLSSGIEKLTLGKSALSSSQPTRNNNSLIDFPPRFLPAPFKPLLFDMAFDSLSEYDLSEIEGIVKASEPASKGGITGVLASLWGR